MGRFYSGPRGYSDPGFQLEATRVKLDMRWILIGLPLAFLVLAAPLSVGKGEIL